MYWIELLWPVTLACALLIAPGLLLGVAMGQRGAHALLRAPLYSVGCVAVAAIIADLLGLRWSLASMVALVVVFSCAAAGLSLFFRRFSPSTAPQQIDRTVLLGGACGGVVGGAILALQLKQGIISPDGISQSYDNIFHLNAIRYIAETGSGSSLGLLSMTSADGSGGFYPAAWHDLVSLVFQAFPGSIPAATNAMTFAVCVMVWPMSVLALALATKPTSPVFVAASGALSACFLAFPGLVLKWGVLYPNMLGYAILPAYLAVLSEAISANGRPGRSAHWWESGAPVLVGTAAVALAHPNALVAAAVFVLPLLVVRLFRAIRTSEGGGGARFRMPQLALGAAVAMCILIWLFIRPDAKNATWDPSLTTGHALGEFLTHSFNGNRTLWSVTLLVLIGAVMAWRSSQQRWITAAWLLNGALWIIAAGAEDGWFRDLMSGPWYNDKLRLGALSAVTAVPLAALALDEVAAFVKRLLERRWGSERLARVLPLVMTAVVVLTGIQLSRAPALHGAWDAVAHEFKRDEVSLLITDDEQNVLDNVDKFVPSDETIVVDPWEGSAIVYALDDRQVTARHSLSDTREEYAPIIDHLDDPSHREEVCGAVDATGARWYLDFQDTLDIGKPFEDQYRGLDQAIESGMVSPVYTSGDAGLYRITGCDR